MTKATPKTSAKLNKKVEKNLESLLTDSINKTKEANFELLLQDARKEAAKNGLTEEILEALLNEED